MHYNQYIVKKRFKKRVICGDINLPYGTICDVKGDFVYHGDKQLCVVTSQDAYDYLWGYDPSNPEKEIARQELAHKLFDMAPIDSGDELANKNNPWTEYGELIDMGMGKWFWNWNKEILDLPVEKLNTLINCVKKGEKPPCFK